MKVLVTGADGFVGKWLCAELLARGHEVTGAARTREDSAAITASWREKLQGISWLPVELLDAQSVDQALETGPDAIVHLAAVASGAEAREDPVRAWQVNCLGTCRLVYALENRGQNCRLVFVSTGEVYGAGLRRPARESDPVLPSSPYAASKAAAEFTVLEYHRRLGGDVVVVRPFAQAGPGQRDQFVVPAFVHRIQRAKQAGEHEVRVGNLEPIREFLDVRDVAPALGLALERGESGAIYNIATGKGTSLKDLFQLTAEETGWVGRPVPDPALFRPGDIPYLVGDGSKLQSLGWEPAYDLRTTVRDVVADHLS